MADSRKYIHRIIAKPRSVLSTILFALLLGLTSLAAAAQQVGEYHIKAVFLCNLAHFVTWPAKSKEGKKEFIIGLYGPDPFGSFIDQTVTGETKNGLPIKVVRYTELQQIDPAQCNILFIHSEQLPEWGNISEYLAGNPVLTVSDSPDFPENGGMINLLKNGQKIEIEINLSSVTNSGLSISSKLLSLARIIE
jgi:hypothetical protein